MTSAARRRAYRRGHGAERIALLLLMLKGYRPLARRFCAMGGEIDLIVKRGKCIVFVEVKTRGDLESAMTAIDRAKILRFSRAVRAWLSRNPWAASMTWRADAVFLAPKRLPRHCPAAFEIVMG